VPTNFYALPGASGMPLVTAGVTKYPVTSDTQPQDYVFPTVNEILEQDLWAG
jgi:hypothetical protein